MHRGSPAEEAGQGIPVAELDDRHDEPSVDADRLASRTPRSRVSRAVALVERQRRVHEREVREGLREVPDEPL